jgi:hypothetical protein
LLTSGGRVGSGDGTLDGFDRNINRGEGVDRLLDAILDQFEVSFFRSRIRLFLESYAGVHFDEWTSGTRALRRGAG